MDRRTGPVKMPITYQLSADGKSVHTKMTGDVTEQQMLSYMSQFVSDERIKPGFSELIDASTGRQIGITTETVEKIIEINRLHSEKLERSKCALVLQKKHEFSLATYFEKLNEGPQRFIVFYNLDVAEKWLGWAGREQ